MMASDRKLLGMAVAMVLFFFVADSVLARGGRGGGGRSSGKSYSRHSGGSNHSIRHSSSRSSPSRQSYNRGSRQSYGGGSRGGSYDRGRYDRPSTGRPGDRPNWGSTRPGDRPARPGDRPGRPGERPGNLPGDRPPGDRYDNIKKPGSWHTPAHKEARNLQQQRYNYARELQDDRQDWVEDNWWRYGTGRYAGVRVYYGVPCTYNLIIVNGHSYYQCGSVWYDRVYHDSQVRYIVVDAP